MKLYGYEKENLIKTIKRVLERDISLYREILIRLELDGDAMKYIKIEKFKPKYWLIAYNEADTVLVFRNSDAQDILNEWYEFYNLPENNYGRKPKNVATFDQLMAEMTLFSCQFILELAGNVLKKGKPGRINIRDYKGFDYDTEEDTLRALIERLEKL